MPDQTITIGPRWSRVAPALVTALLPCGICGGHVRTSSEHAAVERRLDGQPAGGTAAHLACVADHPELVEITDAPTTHGGDDAA